MAALALIFSGCSKENKEQAPADIKSYTKELVQGDVVKVRHQIVPSYDSKGRLSSLLTESNMLSNEGAVESSSKSETTFVYAESLHAAVEIDVLEGDLAFLDKPTVTELSFDDSWKLKSSYYDLLESTYSFEYDGDLMTRYITSGISHDTPFDITWKDGDIVSITDESATVTITYLPDENPFKKGIDPTLDNLLPNYYTYRMTGSHTAHLPASYTNASKTVKTYNYEYKKDAIGRITQIAVKREGETSYNVISIQY